ncbi:MAG: hypothetical protein IPN11_13175 [Opitutaceae bacterium]|nr:hypothetical protein [Opitutaceae bacterium]
MTRPTKRPMPGRRHLRAGMRPLWLLLVLFATLTGSATAQVLYWDTNANTAGAGSSPSGIWTTISFFKRWSTSAGGTTNPVAWTSGRDAVFSAGADAINSYTVTVLGTQNVSSLTVQEGSPTFSIGTINFSDASPGLTIASGSTATFATTSLTSASGNLNLGGGGVLELATNLNLGGTLTFGGGTLRLTDADLNIGTLNITANSVIDFAGSASTLTLSNLVLGGGVTLTILNWTYAVDFFTSAAWAGATYDTMGSSPMNQITFNGFPAGETGWDSFDNQIRPNVPEPATYGVLFAGIACLLFAWQRRREN